MWRFPTHVSDVLFSEVNARPTKDWNGWRSWRKVFRPASKLSELDDQKDEGDSQKNSSTHAPRDSHGEGVQQEG